jgi:hypothetical protein
MIREQQVLRVDTATHASRKQELEDIRKEIMIRREEAAGLHAPPQYVKGEAGSSLMV